MTLPAYLALLDTLLRAATLEDAKAALGPDVMARWARVAVPRWQAVFAQLEVAEREQPAETWGSYLAWRDEQHRAGRWRYPGAEGREPGNEAQGNDLTRGGAIISPWPAGSSRDLGAAGARRIDATMAGQVLERAILPAAQLRLE